MKNKILLLLLITVILISGAISGHNSTKKEKNEKKVNKKESKTQDEESSNIKIEADLKQMIGDVLELSGHVEVSFGEYRFYADSAKFDTKKKTILAEGTITLYSKDNVLSGDKLFFDVRQRKGTMYKASGYIPPQLFYKTDFINQTSNEILDFKKMRLSSCNQLVPWWSISCENGKIVKDKYIRMSNVVFRIKKIPLFYIPYLKYPVKKDGRATGLLFPTFGSSSEKGLFFNNQFFWDIKPNIDITLGIDYYKKIGVGYSSEARWIFKGFKGNVKYYLMDYKMHESDETPANFTGNTQPSDYLIKAEFINTFKFLDTTISAKIDKQSNPDFLRIFSKQFASQLRARFNSSVSLNSKIGTNASFSAVVSESRVYIPSKNFSNTYTALPLINFSLNQQKIWKIPGYFNMNAIFSNTFRTGEEQLDEEINFNRGESKQKLSFSPQYTLDWLKLNWIKSAIKFSGNYNYEFKSIDPETNEILDKDIITGTHRAVLEFKGPTLYKKYNGKKNEFIHLIEPSITYKLVDVTDNINQALKVSLNDYPDSSVLSFGLNSKLIKKNRKNGESITVVDYTISQEYYFDPVAHSKNRKINGEYPEFSELRNRLSLNPIPDLKFLFDLSYNYYLKEFTGITLKAEYNFDESINGSVSFRKTKNPYVVSSWFLNRSSIRGSLNFNPEFSPLNFFATIDYDLTDQKFRYGSIKGTIKMQCLGINGQILIRNDFSGNIIPEFTVGITFGNLGIVKDFLGEDL